MKLDTVQEAGEIIQDLYSSFEDTGIRPFNEDTKRWSMTPMSEIDFVQVLVEYEECSMNEFPQSKVCFRLFVKNTKIILYFISGITNNTRGKANSERDVRFP
jgi:hypothetical protein